MGAVFPELEAQVNSTEEEDIQRLFTEIKGSLKQINVLLTHCLYDKKLFEDEDHPQFAQIANAQLNRVSWVTAVHYGNIVARMMSLLRDDVRPALKIPPTSRNIAEIMSSRIDFHTLTGYAETMDNLKDFAHVWGEVDKSKVQKAEVVGAFQKIVQDYVVNYSIPFQIGADQARNQVSDTSVLSAGTNRFTQWLLEVTLRYMGHTDVLAQQRTGIMVSAMHSNPGISAQDEGRYILPFLADGKMTKEEHKEAVLRKEHGQTSFHTASSKGVQMSCGVTYVHDPENPHIAIKARMAITDEHLDQVAMELLGVDRNLPREVIENINPRYYYNQLSTRQRREAVSIAKRELAEQLQSFYYWYIYINVITKMDIQQVEQRYDQWVGSESKLSFFKYVMEEELKKYDLSEEALDFYKNGPRLQA